MKLGVPAVVLAMISTGVISAGAISTGAMAHSGVTNPAVLARMEVMSAIADEVKALAGMARGQATFDAAEVARGMDAIAAKGAEVPALFETPEQDPASEASPAIWASYPDFTKRTAAMIDAAKAGAGAENPADLQEALAALGETCKSCHTSFRIEN